MRKSRSRGTLLGVIAIGAAMLMVAEACSSTSTPQETASTAGGGELSGTNKDVPESSGAADNSNTDQLKIGLVLQGSKNDGGFFQAAYDAISKLGNEFDFEPTVVEKVPVQNFNSTYKSFGDRDFDAVFGQGHQFMAPSIKAAPKYPDTKFIDVLGNGVDPDKIADLTNLAALNPALADAAYLAGYAAGMASESGKVAALGGLKLPTIVGPLNAFKMGAEDAGAKEVSISYVGSLGDTQKAQQVANAAIASGVDVVFAEAGRAGVGALHAAQENDVLFVGWGRDQNPLAPDTVLTSVVPNFYVMYEDVIKQLVNGNFRAGIAKYGLETGAIGVAKIRAVPDSVALTIGSKIKELKEEIIAGDLEIPFNTES